ncbi:copper resistance protein B [Microbulbifer hainanensis]|uniref:copper resistance protein B n=1 Tax=Microbulbifer hainanensis TaxID=2735675 RepID=UPI001865E720|nr:copper resistance protein B [Microbulbifer hainanensis]
MKTLLIFCAALTASAAVAQEGMSQHEHGTQMESVPVAPVDSYPAQRGETKNLEHAPDSPDHVMDHDRPLTMVKIDQLEAREENGGALKGDLWYGGDRNKLWLKSEWERNDGDTEKAELQALYSRAIAPYWDLQMGVRHDFEAESDSRNWGVIGFNGLAPYFFEVDSALFIGEDGDTALRLEAEYELLFTQQWILTPEVEADFFGQNDRETGTGSGLSNVELGLRLRYEFTPQFAPYFGVHYEKKYGNAADFARDEGESASETTWVIGLRTWF